MKRKSTAHHKLIWAHPLFARASSNLTRVVRSRTFPPHEMKICEQKQTSHDGLTEIARRFFVNCLTNKKHLSRQQSKPSGRYHLDTEQTHHEEKTSDTETASRKTRKCSTVHQREREEWTYIVNTYGLKGLLVGVPCSLKTPEEYMYIRAWKSARDLKNTKDTQVDANVASTTFHDVNVDLDWCHHVLRMTAYRTAIIPSKRRMHMMSTQNLSAERTLLRTSCSSHSMNRERRRELM